MLGACFQNQDRRGINQIISIVYHFQALLGGAFTCALLLTALAHLVNLKISAFTCARLSTTVAHLLNLKFSAFTCARLSTTLAHLLNLKFPAFTCARLSDTLAHVVNLQIDYSLPAANTRSSPTRAGRAVCVCKQSRPAGSAVCLQSMGHSAGDGWHSFHFHPPLHRAGSPLGLVPAILGLGRRSVV